MSSIRLTVIIAIGLTALGVVAACSAATAPAASPGSPPSAAAATHPTPATHPAVPAADTSHASHPSTPPAASEPVIVDCTQNEQVRPGEYVIACADANNQLINLHWTSWGPQTATGVGQQSVNDCSPSCVAGHNHTYPVRVTLSNPTTWPGHHTDRFATMTLDYPEARPAQASAVVAIQLPQ